MKRWMFAVPVLAAGLCLVALAADPAKPAPANPATPGAGANPGVGAIPGAAASHVSELIVKDVKEVPVFVYGSAKTTQMKIRETLMETFGEALFSKVKAAGVMPMGAPVFIYHGATGDPDQEFSLETGVPIEAAGAAALAKADLGKFKVRKLEAFHCASVYYTGPVSGLGQAFAKLYPDIAKSGYQPTDEMREVYLAWEGPDSPNNVIELQVGISKP